MKLICIEGIIGSGKTTLVDWLYQYYQKKYKAHVLKEKFEDNNLLELFYREPQKYHFLVEYSFLINRFHQLHQCFQSSDNEIIFTDYCFRKCLWFAENNLPKQHFDLFKEHFYHLEKELNIQPDLLIFMDVPPEKALQNIKQRNRKMEQFISLDYLQNLYSIYKQHITQLQTPAIIIPVGNYDTMYQKAIEKINKFLL